MIAATFTDPYKIVIWSHRNALPGLEDDPEIEGRRVQRIIDGNYRHPLLDPKWPTMKAAIRTARKIIEKDDWRLIKVEIEALAPHAKMPWAVTEDRLFRWVLTTNPGDIIYEGPLSMQCQYGVVYIQGNGPAPFSAANHGENERLHLLMIVSRDQGDQ